MHPAKRARCAHIPAPIIAALARMQDGLNKFIDVDWRSKRSPDDWGLAVTMESTELMDSYPWKWWKNVSAAPDFNNVRVELVDILHFALSGTMQTTGMEKAVPPADVETAIVAPLAETKNAVRTFRSVIYLAKLHRFDIITEMVIAAADDLEFNLVGYYVAKHTLNYIRQLGGYKNGTYVKVSKGQEDNELLHACIATTTVEQMLDVDGFAAEWGKVMTSVYEAFSVDPKDRRSPESWLA
jgi:dUTP pyrophosphatase